MTEQWTITAYRCTCHNIRWAFERTGATWRPAFSDGVFETGPTVPIYLTLEALSEDHTLHPIAVDNVEALFNTHLATVQQFEDYVEDAIEAHPDGISVGRGDDGTVSIEWDRDGRTNHVMVDPRGAVDVYAELPEGEQERAYLLPAGGVWLTEYAHRNGPDEKLSLWSTSRPSDARLAECVANGCVSRRVWFGPVEPVPTSDTTEAGS